MTGAIINNKITSEMVELFYSSIPLYSKGMPLQLSNGSYAFVSKNNFNKEDSINPEVNIYNPENPEIYETINLNDHRNFLSISRIVTERITLEMIVQSQVTLIDDENLKEQSEKRVV